MADRRTHRSISQLSRPRQDILIRSVNFLRCFGNRDRQSIATGQKLRFARCLHDLADDGAEDRVAGRETDAFLDLNLKDGGLSLRAMRMDNDIIQRVTFRRSLKLDAINDRSRQTAWFCAHEQRQQEESTDLALEEATRWSTRCRACSLGAVCSTCFTHNESWPRWPCHSLRAISLVVFRHSCLCSPD